jgi:hypothetical protein
MRFQHPTSGYVEETNPGWGAAFVAPIYFAIHHAWGHAIGSAVVGLCTYGVGWVIWGCYAKRIVHQAYVRRGWREVAPETPAPAAPVREGYRAITTPQPPLAEGSTASDKLAKRFIWSMAALTIVCGIIGMSIQQSDPAFRAARDAQREERLAAESAVARIRAEGAADVASAIRSAGWACDTVTFAVGDLRVGDAYATCTANGRSYSYVIKDVGGHAVIVPK